MVSCIAFGRMPHVACPACGTQLALDAAPLTLPADDPVVARLQAWRRERARESEVSAYVVLPNATLLAIADARPADLDGLGRIRGIGPGRLERYGEEILAALEPDGLLG